MHPKTTRFAYETATAARIQSVANVRGICIDLVQAHEAWAEHSEDYCAGWLAWRDEEPTNEILQALAKWEGRHGMARRIPTPVPGPSPSVEPISDLQGQLRAPEKCKPSTP